MRKAMAEKWIENLTSGQFQQCEGTLHRVDGVGKSKQTRDGYCCLGVLAEQIKNTKVIKESGWEWSGTGFIYGDYSEQNSLPDEICDAIGMTYGEQDALIHMNDGTHKSFKAIAKKIKAMYIDK